MAMYKTIFVSEEYESSSENIVGINGEVLMFGESAFSSIEQALGSGAENAIIIKVQSGKYDGFAVVTDGKANTDVTVVAVDFDGGEVMVGGETVTVADSGIDAAGQATILADLNDMNAGNGKIFVAASEATAEMPTIHVGMGEAGYVAGQNADIVYAENAEDVVVVLNNMLNVDMLAGNEIYVSSDYNSSTEGFGTTHFANTESAAQYAVNNNLTVNINVVKNNSVSGNCILNNLDGNDKDKNDESKKLTYIVEDGATLANANSKWDMTGNVTVKAGGILQSARPASAGYGNTHVKAVLTVGEAGADKKAQINWINGNGMDYKTMSLAVLYDGKMVANNAIINVGDLGFTGTASMTDCTVNVDGVVAFGKNGFYKQTMTDTTMNVKGHNLMNENSYYSTKGIILNNLTMTNSTIKVDDGVDGTTSEMVTIKNLTMTDSKVITEGAVEVTGTLNINSASTLTADTLTFGSNGKIAITILDDFTGGQIINITGATGLTDDILSKITINNTGYGAYIQDGDVFVAKNQTITSSPDSNTQITGNIVGNDVTITNSKEMAVTGSIEAKGDAKITISNVEGEAQGKLNGGYDDQGKELAAKITAANDIILQNDGHANVDLDAKTIIIANNSKDTLIGNIGTADTEKVIIADGEATADGVTIDDNGVVDGAIKNATITAANIEIGGQEVSETTINGYTEIISDSSFTDVATSGIVSVGYKNENAADTTLTLKGETSIGTLYVGNEGRANEYKAVITGEDTEVSLGQLYNRLGSTLEITDGAHLEVSNYWQSKGDVVIDGASAELTGVNMYVYNNDSTDAATITLRNGASLSTNANYAIYLGNSEGGPAKGNASMTLESGSTLNVKNLILHADGEVQEVAGAKASTSVSVTDSTVNVSGTLTNNGTFAIAGNSTVNAAAFTGTGIVTVADNAKLTDSTFGSATGNMEVGSGITFAGDNTLTAKSFDTFGSFTVEAGGSLTTQVARIVFGNNKTFSANGELAAGTATALTADELAAAKKTLNLNGISISNGGESSFNITNAVANLGNVSTSKYASGTYNFNFTNSYVTTSARWVITNSKDNIQALNITLDGSVFAPAAGFTQQSANGTVTLNNNSKMIASVMKNYGTITINSGSTLELTGYFQQSSHGSQYGDIIVNDGNLLVNGSQAFDLREGATLTVNNGGLVTANQGIEVLAGATLTIDADANIVASKLIGDGTITITNETAGWTGYNKVLDLSGTESMEGKVNIENLAEGVRVIYGDDGDITLTDADEDSLYVNPAYAGLAVGTAIEGKTGVYAGVNAFDTIAKAINAATSETKNIYVAGEFANTQINTSRTLTVAADTSYTQNSSYFRFWAGNLVVKGNVSLSNLSQYQFGSSTAATDVKATLTVDGTSAAEGNNNGKFAINHKLTIYKDAAVEVINGGTFSSVGVTNYGSITADKSKLELAGDSQAVTDNKGTIEALAGSTLNTGHVTNTGTITVDGSTWKFEKLIDRFDSGLTENNGTINISNSTINGGTIDNKGTINVSGASDLVANVTGNGWVYMDGVTLDADTKLDGANVRFASGVNTIDGATIDNGKFQIGQGGYNDNDTRVDTANGVTVNVKNNAVIGSSGNTYAGWIGTGFYDTDAEKAAVMTDARYTLNIDNSTASFGYMHISNDGIMNVTGVADTKETYNSSDYSYYTGDFIINGTAKFDGADVLAAYTKVSCDNGTDKGGHLIITNGTYYEAESHDGADDSKTNLEVRKTGVVDVNGDSTLYVGGKVQVAEDAVINVDDANIEVTGTVTNAGEIKVSGESTINVAKMSNSSNAIQILDGATITESSVNGAVDLTTGTINFAGTNAFTGGMLSAGYYNYGDDLTVNITGDFTASNMVAWGGNDSKTVVNIGSEDARTTYNGGTIGSFYGDTTINITNTDVEYHYIYIQGNLNVSDSTLQIVGDGVNTYFSTGSADHRIAIDNTTWNAGSFTNMGSYDASIASGSAIVDITGGSTFNSGNFTLTTTEGTNHVVDLTVDNSTLNATTAFKVGAGTSASFENGAVLNAASVTNAGTFTADNATITADTFNHQGSVATFTNVDLDVTNFVNGTGNGDAYAVIGGNSKVQIDNLSGYYALRLADGTTLKGGTNIVGATSVRAQGDVTFGETATDVVHIDSFDNNNAGGYTITVNGTLNTNASNVAASSHWFGISGGSNGAVTTLTGNGTINSNGFWNIFQYGAIEIEEGLTINIADSYARDLRFTNADVTLNGVINQNGNNNKLTSLKSANLTISGANAALNVDDYLLVGYHTYYAGGSDTTDAYKSTITLKDGAELNVGGRLIINQGSSITIDAASSFSAGTIENNGGMINSTEAGTIVLNKDMTVAGVISTETLVLNSGVGLTVGSLDVDSLIMTLGSSITITGNNSAIDSVTVTGDILGDNQYNLVLSGWQESFGSGVVSYKGTEYTVVTDGNAIDTLAGINFVAIGGNLYLKDFGAATANIYIGDDVANWTGPVTIDGVEYVKGKNAFASVSDVTGIDADEITSITLGNGDHMSDATNAFDNLTQVFIPAGSSVEDTDIANFSGEVVILNDGHMDVKLVADGTLEVVNTSVNTMLGSYTASWISVDNTGRIGDVNEAVTTLNATLGDIEIANSGIDAIVENVELNSDGNVYLSGEGFGEKISVNAGNLFLYGSDIALENSTVDTIYMTENKDFEFADGGELTLKGGAVIGTVNGYNGDTDKSTGTVIFDGANLTDTAVQDVNKVVLASGTAHSIGKDSVLNDYHEFYTEELNIASGAEFNFDHNDTTAADLHIGTTVSVDGTRVAVTGEGEMKIANDGSEAYSMDNFDVSGFDGTLNVTSGSLVALEEDEDHVAATGTVNADGIVDLNGTTVADIDFAITGDGSVKVNEDKNFTGDISAYTGEYVIADDKTATYTADATLASDMTINGEGTADFADRTNPATVTLTSDTTTTPDIDLHSNSAKLNGGAFGSIYGDADLTVIADSTAQDVNVDTMTVKAGQEFNVAGDSVGTYGAVVASGDITLEGGSDTDRTVLNAEYISGNNITAGDYVTATSSNSIEANDNMTFGNNATVTAINDIFAQNDMTFGDNAKVSADQIFTSTGAISAGDGAEVSGFSKLDSATTITFGNDATITAAVDGSNVPAGDVTAVNDITFGDDATLTVKDIEVTGAGDMTFGANAEITANDVSVSDGDIEIGAGANIDINTFEATKGDITIGDNSTVNVVAETGDPWTNTLNIGAASTVNVTNDIVAETLNIGAGTTATVGGDIWTGNDAGEGIFAADNVTVSAVNISGNEIEFGNTGKVTATGDMLGFTDITFGTDADVTAANITAGTNITFGSDADVTAASITAEKNIIFGDNAAINVSGSITETDGGAITFGDNSNVTVGGDIDASTALTTDPATGTVNFGAENIVDVTGSISAVNAINVGVATELTAGSIYTAGALNIGEHAKVTTDDIDVGNINISILVPDASGFTGPSITLTAAVAQEKLGTLTVDADRSDFVSPYTVIDGVSSQTYNDLLIFVVGSESVNLNVNTAVAQEIAGYWVYGYVNNGDLQLDRMIVDNGEIFVNSDWTDSKGDRFYWGGNDVAHQHIVGNDAAKTLGYAASIVRAKDDGSASKIYIVKGDTYEVDDLTLMTAANGVSKLILSGDEVEPGTPDVAAGDALVLGNLYGTDGSSATSLTLNNIAVKGNFFGGANNAALGGDVTTVINNATTAAAMRGMVFGGSKVTSALDDSAYSSSIALIGGGYSGTMVGGGAYVDGVTYAMKDSTISVAAGENGDRTVISGRLFGGSVAANGATVNQESANINIDLSNGQVYLRSDVYAAGASINGGTVNVAEANVTINGDMANLNFTGRLSGGVYGTAIGSATGIDSNLTFSDATGTFKGLIQDFDTITISGNSAVTFSRKQTLTADTDFVFDLNGRTSADAMFTVNSFGWTYGDTITINAFDGVSGDYTLVGNWSDSYGVNLMIGSTAATIGSSVTVNGNDYTLNVVNDALVLSYVGNNGVGLVDGAELSFANQTIAAGSDGRALSFDGSGDYTDGTVNLTDSTVDGDVYTGRYGEVALNTQGDTTIKGDISGYENLFELTVESGKTTIEGTLSSGKGDDKVVVAAGAELAVETVSTGTNDDLIEISGTMNVTNDIQTGTDEDKINVADDASLSAAVIEMGTGDDTLVVGKNATLTATEIRGGTGSDHLTLEKGAFVTADDVETVETMSIDVDSVLNAGNYSWSTKPLTVTGVAGLTTDVAGAKTIFTNCNANKAINFDGVDAVLGTATQIAGTATTADTSDDVWASLSKVGNNLVVAWGRTEVECGAALDAFNADTTLNLGEALVAVDDSLLDGFDSTDNTTKKSNGSLA